jgi:dipeptidyl aminopeptidase/acylaminoacyl peptidase
MVAAMKRRGVPVEYHGFEGEGHGFRKAATIETCLEAELAFYGRVFGFHPAQSDGA